MNIVNPLQLPVAFNALANSGAKSKGNLLLIYEDLSSGLRGKRMMDQVWQRLARDLGDPVEVEMHLLRFDLLDVPEFQPWTIEEGKGADVVVLAPQSGEISSEVKAWLNMWLQLKDHPTKAMVVAFNGDAKTEAEAEGTLQYLRELADRSGMKLYPYFDRSIAFEMPESAEARPRRIESTIGVEHACPYQSRHWRRWGLNE